MTGHTLDDQAETFLLRLRRGSGVDGLAAMPAKRRVPGENGGFWLLRPMLELTRERLKIFLERQKISWVDDPSNEDVKFDRVEIRKLIQHLTDLGVTKFLLSSTASHMQRAKSALDFQTGQMAQQICSTQMGDLVIGRSGFLDLHIEIRLRLFARALRWVSSNPYNPRFDALVKIIERVLGGKAQTLHGCYILPESEHIRISREFNAVAKKRILLNNDTIWDGRWKLESLKRHSHRLFYVAALGSKGASWVREQTPVVLPFKALQSHPGIYEDNGLRYAPSLIKNNEFIATFCASPFSETFEDY